MKFIGTLPIILFLGSVVNGISAIDPDHRAYDVDGTNKMREMKAKMGITINGLKKKPGVGQLAFIIKCMRRAYNNVHFERDDDLLMLGGILTDVEFTEEKEENDTGLFHWLQQDTVGRDRTPYTARGSMYYGCNFCLPENDDSLEFGYNPPPAPLKNPQYIADCMCNLLKKYGDKAYFGEVQNCKIFPTGEPKTFLYNKEEEEEKEEVTASEDISDTSIYQGQGDADSNIAATFTGLECGEDFAACNNDAFRQAIGDALTVAYSQVYFQEYILSDFSPASLEIIPNDTPIASDASLRGVDDDHTGMTRGSWRGKLNVACRFCEDDTSMMKTNPMYLLSDVEHLFCGMMDEITKKMPALINYSSCTVTEFQEIKSETFEYFMELEETDLKEE